MKNTYRIFIASVLVLLFLFSGSRVTHGTPSYTVSARAVIFSDSTRVKRLYGKNVHQRVPPASTVKVMTALLVLERLPLKKIVSVSQNATRPQPIKINLKSGERYRVADLLHAVLIRSANDASVVLAEAVAGSEEKFVKMMNRRARELGCRNTRFANPHGLPSQKAQYTTPYDMYLIFRAALKHAFFRTAITHQNKTITSQNGRRISLRNNNRILRKDWRQKLYGKTGWTREAGGCFVGYTKKGRNILIIAIFGAPRRWDDIKHIVTTYGGIRL